MGMIYDGAKSTQNDDDDDDDGMTHPEPEMQESSATRTPPRAVIGLEIHCQMTNLNSKLFCPCKADYRGMKPNENTCPICMGIPGTLPLLNREAVCKGAMVAMALGCEIPDYISFVRKNYFYPDLPKNFQITQLNLHGDVSMGGKGMVEMPGGQIIRIRRIQLEEDPGRMIYEGAPGSKNRTTLVDYNRAGTALVEIVTEPDFEGPRQVRVFLQMLSDMVANLGMCDPALEGAMRADANVSLQGGNRVEIKNISSFHDLEKAVIFEITRQEAQYSRGLEIPQETRHWDAARKITASARLKEADDDYRYLPEADIPSVIMDKQTLDDLRLQMPEGVSERRLRYEKEYGMPPQVADVLSSDKDCSDLFEASCTPENAREVANIITTDLMGMMLAADAGSSAGSSDGESHNDDNGDGDDVSKAKDKRPGRPNMIAADQLCKLADSIVSGRMSRNSAKQALHEMVRTGKSLDAVSDDLQLGRVSDESELGSIVAEVMTAEPDAARQAVENPNTINYLVGKVMQKTRGRADPKTTLEIIKKTLASMQDE